jgi:hypothetical protein
VLAASPDCPLRNELAIIDPRRQRERASHAWSFNTGRFTKLRPANRRFRWIDVRVTVSVDRKGGWGLPSLSLEQVDVPAGWLADAAVHAAGPAMPVDGGRAAPVGPRAVRPTV